MRGFKFLIILFHYFNDINELVLTQFPQSITGARHILIETMCHCCRTKDYEKYSAWPDAFLELQGVQNYSLKVQST